MCSGDSTFEEEDDGREGWSDKRGGDATAMKRIKQPFHHASNLHGTVADLHFHSSTGFCTFDLRRRDTAKCFEQAGLVSLLGEGPSPQ